jgi:hypothetical protein
MTTDDSWMRIVPGHLTWADVDPARHPFDEGNAAAVDPPPTWAGSRLVGREEAGQWRAAVKHALVDRYGPRGVATYGARVPAARFRTGPAYAKGGRERYGWRPDLAELFDECPAEATDDDAPLPSRAARVYPDVALFHPFDDAVESEYGSGRDAFHYPRIRNLAN